MDKPLQAERFLKHPIRLFVTGRSKCGKTTEVVRLINTIFRPQVDRLVVCCPSWFHQHTFDPIRDLVDPKRDILNPNEKDPFYMFFKKLEKQKELAELKKMKPINTLLFIDDMAGQKCMASRLGSLANLSIQPHHMNLSIVMISQYPKLACQAFRINADAYICYPQSSKSGREWIHEELNSNNMSKEGFDKLIDKAWRGKRKDYDEMHQHFLFILIQIREKTRYFVDFTHELKSVPGIGSNATTLPK